MKKASIKVTSKGQITLPREIRDKLNITQGTHLYVQYVDDQKILLSLYPKALTTQKRSSSIVAETAGLLKDVDMDPNYVEDLRKTSVRRMKEIEGLS